MTAAFFALKTGTPTLIYTDELLYTMANISKLVNIKWFLGAYYRRVCCGNGLTLDA